MSTTEQPTGHAANADIIGRDEIDDIEAILSVSNVDVDEVEHVVKDNADAIFTWDYSLCRPQLRKLYEKAKVGQWNGTTDLPWDTEIQLDEVVTSDQAAFSAGLAPTITPALSSRSGAIKSGSNSASIVVDGRCRSSFTVSKVRCCAPPKSPKRFRGTTPNCMPQLKLLMRPVTLRSSLATSMRKWTEDSKSTHTFGCCSMTSSKTRDGYDLPRHASHGRRSRSRSIRIHAPND